MFEKCRSEGHSIKSGIGVVKQSVTVYPYLFKLHHNSVHTASDRIQISMIHGFQLEYGQRQPVSVSEEYEVCRLALFLTLTPDAPAAFDGRSMRTVNVGHGQIEHTLVVLYYGGEHFLPVSKIASFTVVVKYSLVTRRLPAEKMTYVEIFPLTSSLELIKYGVNDVDKRIFADITHFCNT